MSSRGVNKVILIGNLGQEPDVKTTDRGSIVNLSLATSESWTDKATGQKQERTEWHRVVVFNRLADVARQYLSKGSKVYIEGSLRTRKWQDQQGNDRYSTEIVAGSLTMLDSRNHSAGDYVPPVQNVQTGSYVQNHGPSTSPAPINNSGASPYGASGTHSTLGGDFDDDPLPF